MIERNEQLEDEVHKLQNEKITLDMSIKQMNSKAQQRQNQHEKLMEDRGNEIIKLTNELNDLKEALQQVTSKLNSQNDAQDKNETPQQLVKKIIIPDLSTPPPCVEENVQKFGAVPKVFRYLFPLLLFGLLCSGLCFSLGSLYPSISLYIF